MPDLVVRACNPRTWEMEVVGLGVEGQFSLHSKFKPECDTQALLKMRGGELERRKGGRERGKQMPKNDGEDVGKETIHTLLVGK